MLISIKKLKTFILTVIFILIAVTGYAGNSFLYPRFKAIDGNGDPIRGGLLYSYVAGTSTAKNTYSDRACTTANANPVVLDSNGEATVYLLGTYKFNLKTSSLAQVQGWPVDNIQGTPEAYLDYYYPDYGATDQGLTGSNNTIKYYVDTIGATKKATIFLRHNSGGTNTDYTFSTNETITSNITLHFEPGARLAIAIGITVTGQGGIDALLKQQIFSLTGTGKFSFATSSVKEVYPEWWGDNAIPGTTDMTDEINAAFASLTAYSIQPTGSFYVGTLPPVVFSQSRYKVSDAITGMGVYSHVISNGGIIEQSDDTKDIFDFANCTKVKIDGVMVLNGGKRQIRMGNNNTDESQLIINGVQFAHNHSDAALEVYLVAPATNLSMSITINQCTFTAVYQVAEFASGTYSVIKDSWIHLGEINLTRAAIINGVDSVLLLDNVVGVPHATLTPTGARWIDNYGEFKAINSRFGGEGGGYPIVYQYEATRTLGLGGGSVNIQNCQLSCGAVVVKNSIVHLMTGIPSLISIKDNNWISKDTTDFISIDGTFDAATYINALTSNDHIFINVDNNDAVIPLESAGLPATLISTDPSKVFVNKSFEPYIYGKKRSLLNFNGPNAGTKIKDEYSKTAVWTKGGNAALTTTSPRFGSACLSLPDATSYLINTGITSLGAKFTLEGWFRLTDVTDNDQYILNFINAGSFGLYLFYNRTAENDKKLRLFASSDGLSNDIANGTAGSKVNWVNDTWYKYVIEFTGARYSVYIGVAGSVVTEDIGVNSVASICVVTAVTLGNTGFGMIGAIDDFRMDLSGCRYRGLFIPESQEFNVD